MQISAEGKIGIGLGLLAMAGGGAAVTWPTHIEIGVAMMATAALGGVLLAINHIGLPARWRPSRGSSFRGVKFRPDWGVRIDPSPPKRWRRPRKKTHPYDVPAKLKMIDDLLAVLNDAFPQVSKRGFNITTTASSCFRNNEKEKLDAALKDLLAITTDAEDCIRAIVRGGAKFDDVVEILGYRDYISKWFMGVTALKKDIDTDGFDPDKAAGHFLSVINLLSSGQLEMNRWAQHTREALRQHRKLVVSGKA